MKQLIIALFALLSINASAQTLSDRVEETIVKPLEKYGIHFTKSETNFYHNRKGLAFTIPLWKSPDATTNDSTTNATMGAFAEQFQKAYETLLQGLQQLRKSAYESYWWEKNDCDSMMISMSWNPRKDYKTYSTISKALESDFGADYIQVKKIPRKRSSSDKNVYLTKSLTMFVLTYSNDSDIVGTKPFNIQAYKKSVESAFKKKGIVSKTFDYRYSKNYLQKHPELYTAHEGMEIPNLCAAHGDVHFIPKDMAMQFIKEFKALTHTYLDSHHDESYTFSDFSYNSGMIPTLENARTYPNRSVLPGTDSSHPLFTVWVDQMKDGRFAVIMSESYGRMGMRIVKEYWKYKTINDDKKVEY